MCVELHRTAFSQTALKLDWTCPVLSEWGNHTLEVALLFKKMLNTRSLPQILWSVRNLQPFARAPGGAAVDRVSQTYSTAPGIPAAATSISSIFNVEGDAALFFSQRAEAGTLTLQPLSAQNPVLTGKAAAGHPWFVPTGVRLGEPTPGRPSCLCCWRAGAEQQPAYAL